MDNDNLSKVPVSELTKANLDAMRRSSQPAETKSSKKTKRGLVIAIVAVCVVGLGVALFFLLRQSGSNPEPTDPNTEIPDSEIVWEPSEDAVDPGAEYTEHLQSVLDNPEATDDEKLQSEIQLANLDTVMDNFEAAEARLNAVDRTGLTYRQQFNLYRAYAYLYQHSGDKTKYNEYSMLVEEVLAKNWEEEIK